MYPQYVNVTYPDQRSQMPYIYNYPIFHIPSQMRVNPVRHFPTAYEPWPCGGGNYGYQIPDINNYFPPYHYSGYPYPYHPPPLPYFHDACCPSFSKMHHHPVHYAPPPNYSMEHLPIYDYDKKPNLRCPNHLCCSGGDTKEKGPDVDKRTDSLPPPAQSKNLPYPFVWISPEEVNTERQMYGGFTDQPQPMNSSDQPRDSFKLEKGKRVDNQTNLEDGSQFPLPIIWIPYKHEEAGKKDNAEKKTTPTLVTGHEEVSPFESSKENVGSNVAQATTMVGKNGLNHCKLIPVKQLDATENNHTVSKEPENELAKNSPVGGNKRFKLPPVCLRVEPFPKRKNGSGKSRSLSPPKRGKPEELVSESFSTMGLKEDMKSAKENEQRKLAHVADLKTNQAEMPRAEKEVGNSEAMEKVKRTELTEVKAAIIIQAAYRGYEVRRWEPIKKLKAIGKVREELNEVKSRINAMEFSSSSSDKEASLLGEMIMTLLLKLDTIQGLDPVTRDMRKSTAKELVNLQEEVDSVVNNNVEDVNSPQMETKTTGSEEVKVGEGEEEVKVDEGEVEEVKVREGEEEVKVDEGEVEEVKVGEGEVDEEEVKVDEGEVEEVKVDEGEVEEEEVKVDEGEVEEEEVKGYESEVATKKEEEEEKAEVIALEETAEGDNGGVTDEGLVTTITTSSGEMLELKEEKGVDMEMNEEKVCEEALMGEADNGGASDEGLGEDICVITSTEIELKEEEEEKSSGDEDVRLMMEKLVEKGKEQLEVITELSERIKMLEKKLATKKAAAKKGKSWGRTKTRPRR